MRSPAVWTCRARLVDSSACAGRIDPETRWVLNPRSDPTSFRRSSPRPLTRTDLGAEDDVADRAHRVALDTHDITRFFLALLLFNFIAELLRTSVTTTASNRLIRLDAAAAVMADLDIPIHKVEKGTEISWHRFSDGRCGLTTPPQLRNPLRQNRSWPQPSSKTASAYQRDNAGRWNAHLPRRGCWRRSCATILIVLNANYEALHEAKCSTAPSRPTSCSLGTTATPSSANARPGQTKNFGEAIDQLLSHLGPGATPKVLLPREIYSAGSRPRRERRPT